MCLPRYTCMLESAKSISQGFFELGMGANNSLYADSKVRVDNNQLQDQVLMTCND